RCARDQEQRRWGGLRQNSRRAKFGAAGDYDRAAAKSLWTGLARSCRSHGLSPPSSGGLATRGIDERRAAAAWNDTGFAGADEDKRAHVGAARVGAAQRRDKN